MENLEKLLESMTLEFFGNKQHKITSATFLLQENSLFLDVRAQEEFETIAFTLLPYMPVLHIPINEIPKKLEEIPRNKNIGIFCSSGFRSTIVYLYLKTYKLHKFVYQLNIDQIHQMMFLERSVATC